MIGLLAISLLLGSILVISHQPAYAEQIITAKSTSLETTSILELKNNQGNTANIESVRIWLSEDNSFKSFKTEKGWTGKFEVGGQVLVFTTQELIKPGENVKFGIKTVSENPAINWKAIDQNDQVIQSAKTITAPPVLETTPEINTPETTPETTPEIIAIKNESIFRFIPEKPSPGSDFRILGENFVPNQNLDFYIGDYMIKSITTDNDGKFITTATIPDNFPSERTDFIMADSGGSEKTVSIRLSSAEKREISETIKISIGNTPQNAKRGETVIMEGNGTPNTTLTLTTSYQDGTLLGVNTASVGSDGKWSFDFLISPDFDLKKINIEVTDGKSKIIRNVQVHSANLINISSLEPRYEIGDTVTFSGTALPNEEISLIIEDPIQVEIFSRTLGVGDSGNITFDFKIDNNFMEGTYILYAFQGNEQGVSAIGIGEPPKEILIVDTSELNYASGDKVDLRLNANPNSVLSLIVVDSSDREKISDTVNLGPDGFEIYYVDTTELGTGSFTVEIRHGNSVSSAIFTIGLSTGSGPIVFSSTKDEYEQGDQVLILGKTGIDSLLTITFSYPNGNIIKKVETFSDKNGIFKLDNFRIPPDGNIGNWNVNVKSGGNFANHAFSVFEQDEGIIVTLDRENNTYTLGETITITGAFAVPGVNVAISILDIDGNQIDDLDVRATNNGEYYYPWTVPIDLVPGTYEIIVDDFRTNNSISFSIV
jgi:hypothetical protein